MQPGGLRRSWRLRFPSHLSINRVAAFVRGEAEAVVMPSAPEWSNSLSQVVDQVLVDAISTTIASMT
jgi:hypothetical protein